MLNKVTKIHWLLIPVFAILLYGCTATPEGAGTSTTPSAVTKDRPSQYSYAVELMKRGELEKAYGVFNSLVSSYPHADLYANLAIIDVKRKKYESAKQNIDKSIAANDKNAISRNINGLIMVNTGNLAQAESEYKKSIEIAPNYADPYLNLAIMYDMYLNLPKKALPYYERYKETADNKANKDIDKWLVEVQRRAK